MIQIDQLPVEILINIFSYLPSYSRVSLVNKLFYNVACSDNSKITKFYLTPFRLDRPEHQSMMDSIQKTMRKISKVSILLSAGVKDSVDRPRHFYESAISDMGKILKHFSATLKFLRLECARGGLIIQIERFLIEMPDFLELLSMIPNAEHLELLSVFVGTLSQTKGQVNNESLKLDHLKTLDIQMCDKEFLTVFSRLSPGVLKEFTFSYYAVDFDVLTGFFTKQQNIKNLTLSDEDDYSVKGLPPHIFDHLKLDSLVCYQNEYAGRFAKILSKQIQLTSLALCSAYTVEVDGSVLDVITNQLTELVTLEFTFDKTDKTLVQSFRRITKLKKLKELTIGSCPLKIIEAFAGLDNSRITTLSMKEIDTRIDVNDDEDPPMPINVISALANSVPNLKSLQFDYHCECPAIGAIMEHFNFVEELQFNFDMAIDAKEFSETIEVEKSFNAKLEALRCEYFTWDELILTKLIAMYPNLKYLHISSSTKFTATMSSNLQLILNGFKQMNSLSLYLEEWEMTAEHLDCIIDSRTKLKWMTLGRLKELSSEHLSKLTAVFDAVKFAYGTLNITN